MVTVPIYIPTISAGGSLFSIPSPAFIDCVDDGHSDCCEVIPYCSFHLHFSSSSWCWASCRAFSAICMVQTTRVGLTLFCLPLTSCSALLQVSKAPCVSQLVSLLGRRLLWVWDPLLSFSSPSRGVGSISCPFILSFIRPGCAGIFLVLLAIWGPLLVFSRCCENCFICIFLMWERWTPHLPLLLPWL